jgi:hypothetical protein
MGASRSVLVGDRSQPSRKEEKMFGVKDMSRGGLIIIGALIAMMLVPMGIATAATRQHAGIESTSERITSVTISGTLEDGFFTNPKFIIRGSGFGRKPIPSFSDPCGYTGSVYASFSFHDLTPDWFAGGVGTGGSYPDCIGLTKLVWKGGKIKFDFGSGYGRSETPVWRMSPGDSYVVTVGSATLDGTVP